jgi:hypothetical protein
MKISRVHIQNFKSLADTGEVSLNQVNLLVGRNNHGKSAFVRAVHLMQAGAGLNVNDVRLGESAATVNITLTSSDLSADFGRYFGRSADANETTLTITVGRQGNSVGLGLNFDFEHKNWSPQQIPNQEPNNFIYSYLSKRKVTGFDQQVNLEKTQAVQTDLRNIVSKVARLANPDYVHAGEYEELCKAVLGFRISTFPSPSGQQAGIPVGDYGYIPIEAMGEGVSSQLGLITDLCMADGNLFLIEEPENDIHPEGLKTLLDVIVDKSRTNQFIVTTHSNIVMRHLGAAPDSKIFEFESTYLPNTVPTSTIREVEATPQARIEILRRLGYELSDFELWDGWLILEESSAEIIIRYLIPWFVPGLARVRTVAAGGTSKVEPTFEDFRRLFLFAHLEPQYKGRAWVVVDGDDEGKRIVTSLQNKYRDWGEGHFSTWDKPDFEQYYPARFAAQVEDVLSKPHDAKPAAKKQLLDEVKQWCDTQPAEAKEGFAESAAEVIGKLKAIDRALVATTS